MALSNVLLAGKFFDGCVKRFNLSAVVDGKFDSTLRCAIINRSILIFFKQIPDETTSSRKWPSATKQHSDGAKRTNSIECIPALEAVNYKQKADPKPKEKHDQHDQRTRTDRRQAASNYKIPKYISNSEPENG